MFKKGGIFFIILLTATLACALDKTSALFTPNNPNLINLNESYEYKGQPLVYIQGVKAPEKATNDLEELQLKLFGTKNVREATKDTQTFDTSISEAPPITQEDNFIFETPFHHPVQAAYIRHISDFVVMIQLLNAQQLTITEQQIVMNTEDNLLWSRKIPLPEGSSGQLIGFVQNDQTIPVTNHPQTKSLTITAPIPLQKGLNRLTLKYNIDFPTYAKKDISLDLTGTQLSWPIERFQVLLLVPKNLTFTQNQLLFGTNELKIPSIYTQNTDERGNTFYQLNRILPANAPVLLQMTFDPTQLDELKEEDDTSLWILFGAGMIMLIYWFANYAWENKKIKKVRLNKLKFVKNPKIVAAQMHTFMTADKWNTLLEFQTGNNLPTHWEKYRTQSKFSTKWSNLIQIGGEIILGTLLIFMGAGLLLKPIHMAILGAFALCGTIILYIILQHRIAPKQWENLMMTAQIENVILGLTTQQILRLYPLFVIAGTHLEWREKLERLNPSITQWIERS